MSSPCKEDMSDRPIIPSSRGDNQVSFFTHLPTHGATQMKGKNMQIYTH